MKLAENVKYLISDIVIEVRADESSERHLYLYKVVKGLTTFEELTNTYGSIDRFNFDMAALQNEDLIRCQGNEWSTCTPSDYAPKIVAKMGN
jgi:hypothetical protein